MRMTLTIILAVVVIVALAAAFLYSRDAGAAPAEGTPAPGFALLDQHGKSHTLSDYEGRWLVLYFYPKADTPGCTTEACNFRDDIFKFRELGVDIVGVSLDDVESQAEFAEKYSLPFVLLSDADGEAATAYGVLTKMGPLKFAKRESFIIDPQGRVAKHYGKVNPDTHSAEVLDDLKVLLATN